MSTRERQIRWAVTPVASPGWRLLPLTKSQPKEMLSLGTKPVIQYVVDEIVNSGIRQILFVTGPGKSAIENHFTENNDLIQFLRTNRGEELLQSLEYERNRVKYFFTRQRRPTGVGEAVLCSESIIGDQPFVVALGDTILGVHAKSDCIRRMTDVFFNTNADAVIALESVPPERVSNFGIATPKPNGKSRFAATDGIELERLIEKPKEKDAESNLAIASRYICRSSLFDALHETERDDQGFLQLTDALNLMIDRGKRVVGVLLNEGEKRFDIGGFEDYFQAFVEFAIEDPKYGDSLKNTIAGLIDSNYGR